MKQATEFKVHKGWQILLNDMGIKPSDLLAMAQLPADLFSREEATISSSEYFRIFEALEELSGPDEIALKFGQSISVEAFDPPIFASLCSPNLNVAFTRLSEYKRLIGPMILEVEITEKSTSATIECYGYDSALPKSLGAMEMVFLTQLVRLGIRQNVTPIDIVLETLPDSPAPYEAFFSAPIRKGSSNTIRFSALDAKRPFLTDNPAMWSFFDQELKKRLADLDSKATTSQRVRSTLYELLPSGQTSIEDVSAKLAISKRTLQRHLKNEQSNFQQILNSTRARLAEHYLTHSSIPSGEISFLLGFQDYNSFQRAFKTWKGTSPNKFRTEAQAIVA